MHKRVSERIRDFFINMGKHHRILLPLAVVGLAVTMLFTRVFTFFLSGTKRLACALFILCFFMIGNSFAYPYLNFANGFASDETAAEEEVAAAPESSMNLTEGDEMAMSADAGSNIAMPESGEALEGDDTYSLDDIVRELEAQDSYAASEDPALPEPEEEAFLSSDWRLVLVNKQHPIPEDYTFTLGTIMGSMQCDERILPDLVDLLKDAKAAGLNMNVASPYRPSNRQVYLFDRKIDQYMKNGYSYMNAYKLSSQAVTVPGASEHQIGLAIDFNSPAHPYLDEAFGDTPEGTWLREHCAEYGFVIRYLKGKEYITSIEYEPWHLRYVGKEAASIMMAEEICLEEFWEKYVNE